MSQNYKNLTINNVRWEIFVQKHFSFLFLHKESCKQKETLWVILWARFFLKKAECHVGATSWKPKYAINFIFLLWWPLRPKERHHIFFFVNSHLCKYTDTDLKKHHTFKRKCPFFYFLFVICKEFNEFPFL